jgi:hypothetical protein
MNWISTKDDLPKDRERVIIFTKEPILMSKYDEPIHIRTANFVRGITKEERDKMKKGELTDPIVNLNNGKSSFVLIQSI